MSRARADDDLAHVRDGVGDDLDTMLVHNLLRTHSHLSPFIDAGLRRQNLTSAQLNVLLALRSAGRDGLRMGQIDARSRSQILVVAGKMGSHMSCRNSCQVNCSRRTDQNACAASLTLVGAFAERRGRFAIRSSSKHAYSASSHHLVAHSYA